MYSPLEAAGAELRQTLGQLPALGGSFHDVPSEHFSLVIFDFLPDYGYLVNGDNFFGDDFMSPRLAKTWLIDTYKVKDGSIFTLAETRHLLNDCNNFRVRGHVLPEGAARVER